MRVAGVLLFGPWAPASLAFARSLRRQGIATYLLQAALPGHHTHSAFSALQGASTIPADAVGTRAGIGLIRQYASDVGATALVAILDPDLVWLAAHRDAFEPACRLLIPSSSSLVSIQSKCHQIDLARKAGLTVLPTHILMCPEDVDSIPASGFPLALRPDRQDDVAPAFKVRIARSREDARTVLREGRRIGAPVIAQPFRRLPNLLVHAVRSIDGDVLASRCYAVPRKFEGVSLAVEPQPFPGDLDPTCREFAALAGLTGCYHFEFLFSAAEGRAYFLEVNVRLGGTTEKVVRLGFDEPALLLQAYGLDVPRGPSMASGRRRIVNKRVLLKHVVRAATGTLTEFDYPAAGRLRHVADSCRDPILAKDSVFDWRDVAGSLRFHLRGLLPL